MRKIWIKKTAALVVFILAIIITDLIINRGNAEVTMEMQEATLPVVSAVVEGHKINTMYGYKTKREETYTKDSITPITADREITIAIEDYGAKIGGISYEVRSTDGERLIERSEVSGLRKTSGEIRFTIQLKDLTDENREYAFVTILTMKDGTKAYYYARFIESEEYYAKEKLDYILGFHETTFGNTDGEELRKYLESNAKGNNGNFHKVNINSSLIQVMWDELPVKKESEARIFIKDITETTASVILKYLVEIKKGAEENYAFVEEYYRVRYTPQRMYLLDYERTMDEIFSGSRESFNTDKILLGINNENVVMAESEGGSNLAFVNGSRLFTYNSMENRLTEVFSFYNKDHFDERTRNRNFEIRILDIEDSGNVTFAVAGYMNRGLHEGRVGIVVYYYDSLQNTIEEQIFIPYKKAADILIKELDNLFYLNMENHLFLIMEGNLYDINIPGKEYTILISELTKDNYKISQSGRMVSRVNSENGTIGNRLEWLNLSHGTRIDVRAGYNEYIKVLGFMGEDLIYGVAKKQAVKKEANGNILFPVYKIFIINEQEKVLKEYEKEGYYVTDCEIVDNQITLKRIKETEDNQYEAAEDDHIASNDTGRESVNVVSTVIQEKYETITQIILKNTVDTGSLKRMNPKEVIFEGGREIALKMEDEKRFYTYGPYGLELITSSSGEAISRAYEISGTAMDEGGNYIWRKGTIFTKNQIMAITGRKADEENTPLAVCLDTILEFEGISRKTQPELNKGEDAFSILDNSLREEKILDLTGCPMDTVLYYVDQDIPVLALMGDSEAYLIIGFNEQNVVLMDPATGTVYKKGMNDSRMMFMEKGNQFLTYVRPD